VNKHLAEYHEFSSSNLTLGDSFFATFFQNGEGFLDFFPSIVFKHQLNSKLSPFQLAKLAQMVMSRSFQEGE
jgi:hypothetical protein